jgi:hypothetical protein
MSDPENKVSQSLGECLKRIQADLPKMEGPIGFRGEAAKYDHTYSLIYRLIYEQKIIPVEAQGFLIDLLDEIALKMHLVLNQVPLFRNASDAAAHAQKTGPWDPIEIIGGFLQHYYLPTDLLDVTDSLEIATKFAAFPDLRYKDDEVHIGQIYVFNLKELKKNGHEVFSLLRSMADRPRKQKAYSIVLGAGEDLQNVHQFPRPQVLVYQFKSTNALKKTYYDPGLMNARGDRVAKEAGYVIYQICERYRNIGTREQKIVLHYLGQTICGKLIDDEAHL